MGQMIDLIRTVPETAVRLYLGAKISGGENGRCTIDLDGRSYEVSLSVLDPAERVVRALRVRTRTVQYATDVLELRLAAEDLFMEDVFGVSALRKILFVPAGDMMASAFYRARMPADLMSESGKAVSHFTDHLDLAKALRYEILWIQLASSPVLYRIASEAKAQGVKIVYDVDDRFDAIPPENPAAAIYVAQKVDAVWKIIEMADMVTVSTNNLRDHIKARVGDKVRVLTNMIPATITPNRAQPPKDITRILWAGSPTHKRDLAVMAPALSRILNRNEKVRFTCFGEQPPEGFPAESVDLLPFVPFTEYLDKLAGVGAHFALAPLEDNAFNSGKSAVKHTEYAAVGYPSLLSPVGEYAELPEEAGRILVKDNEWETAITNAIEAPGVMNQLANQAQGWVRKNRCIIKTKAAQWLEAAEEVMKK